MADGMSAIIQRAGRGFRADCPELPGVQGRGESREEALAGLSAAIARVRGVASRDCDFFSVRETPAAGSASFPPLDRAAFSVVPLKHSDRDLDYWLSRTPQERLAAAELIRQMVYGHDRTRARLQRVLEIAQLGRG